MMKAPINLRDCPMCHEPPREDHGPTLFADTMIDLQTGEATYEASYEVRCICCGASVSHEYLDDAVRLWNGEQQQDAEE